MKFYGKFGDEKLANEEFCWWGNEFFPIHDGKNLNAKKGQDHKRVLEGDKGKNTMEWVYHLQD